MVLSENPARKSSGNTGVRLGPDITGFVRLVKLAQGNKVGCFKSFTE